MNGFGEGIWNLNTSYVKCRNIMSYFYIIKDSKYMINLARGNQSFVICCNCNITKFDKLWFLFENMCIIIIFYYQEHVELTYFKVMRPQFIKGILINKYNGLLWLYELSSSIQIFSLPYFSLGISSSDELLCHVSFSTLIRDDIYTFSSKGLCLAPLHTILFPVFKCHYERPPWWHDRLERSPRMRKVECSNPRRDRRKT